VNDVLNQNERVLKDPAPVVRVSVLSDSSINIAVKPWVNVPDYGPVSGEVNKAIVEEFRARSISIPFPQTEVRLLNPVPHAGVAAVMEPLRIPSGTPEDKARP
jgi:small conductance mechanosensitive channel